MTTNENATHNNTNAKSTKKFKGAHMFTVYKQVANITEKVLKHQGSVKSLALGDKSIQSKSQTFALASQVLKFHKVIDYILNESKFYMSAGNKQYQKSLVRVAVYEALFGQAASDPKYLKDMLDNYANLRHPLFPKVKSCYSGWNQCLVQIKIEHNQSVKNNDDLLKLKQFETEFTVEPEKDIPINRFLRVNTLKTTVEDVISQLKEEGFPLVATITDPNTKAVLKDEHISELLQLFPQSTSMHEFSFVQNGNVIVQDKASCLPVHILIQTLYAIKAIPPQKSYKMEEFHFIDACAAPGNKTSFLAAKIALNPNSGKMKVFAFDRDDKRIDILRNRLEEAGAIKKGIVEPIHNDFLKIDPQDERFKNVRAIMLDPSCSGSGIVGRGKNDETEDRLEKLHNFQCTLLRHAFTFPNVQCVVYSTCSVHETENEKTVFNVINGQEEQAMEKLFGLYRCFPEWRSRGTSNDKSIGKHYSMEQIAPYVVRCYPKEHLTNGFFVSCFVRNTHLAGDDKVEKIAASHPAPTSNNVPSKTTTAGVMPAKKISYGPEKKPQNWNKRKRNPEKQKSSNKKAKRN